MKSHMRYHDFGTTKCFKRKRNCVCDVHRVRHFWATVLSYGLRHDCPDVSVAGPDSTVPEVGRWGPGGAGNVIGAGRAGQPDGAAGRIRIMDGIRKGQVSLMTEAAHGPTVLRILLGTHLRRLRESRGISAQQAARVIRGSESKISRIELGRNAIREIDILDLLTYYGVGRDDREQLLALAEQANRPGWWHRHNDILPEWFQTYVGMEESAASIRMYEPQFIPGLLQTEAYAAAVFALGDFSPAEAERHVLIRKERQRRFGHGDLNLWVIVEEPALRRPVSDSRTHCDQIRFLLEASERPNLTLQVVPYGVGGHAVPSGFSVLRFADRELPDIVYVEHLTSALYLDKQVDVDQYMLALERLSVVSARPSATPGILRSIISELEGDR